MKPIGFTAETLVAMSGGRKRPSSISLIDLVSNKDLVACARNGIIRTLAMGPSRHSKHASAFFAVALGESEILEIVLDSGAKIRCSPDQCLLSKERVFHHASTLQSGFQFAGMKDIIDEPEIEGRKVVSIKALAGLHAVYALRVPTMNNYQLDNGVFAKGVD